MNADGSNVHQWNAHASFTAAQLRRTSWSSATPSFASRPPNIDIITGDAVVGEPLETSVPSFLGSPGLTLGYQWLRCQPSNLCNNIAGANDPSYTPTSADLGIYIRAVITKNGSQGIPVVGD